MTAHPIAAAPLTICIAEDRATCEPPLRLLIASLLQHVPDAVVLLFCPNASDSFARWLAGFPQCRLSPAPLNGVWTKYDIKPLALLSALTISETVIWLDSDIIVARDFRPYLSALDRHVLVAAEEALMDGHQDPGGLRARLWGMPVGRELPFSINTAVLRVTREHRALLEAWNTLLTGDLYRAAQELPWYDRPSHLAGDQEVLTALLSSSAFSAIPLHFLYRGRDIIQFFGPNGYTVAERWRHLREGMPYFVHSQGFRPWWPTPPPTRGVGARFRYLNHALSPYTVLARQHRSVLEEQGWLAPPTRAARWLTTSNAPLNGLPLAVMADMVRKTRSLAAWWRRPKR